MDEIKVGTTYFALILDKSGSMWPVRKETVSGYNEQVQVLLEEARKPERGEVFASLIMFNGKIDEKFFNQPISALKEMTEDQYEAKGGTALDDAIGYTLTKLRDNTDSANEYNSYLVDIITDGQELNSQIWKPKPGDKIHPLTTLIEELENTNRWTITCIGPQTGVQNLKERLRLRTGNTIAYDQTVIGTATAFHANAKQMKSWFDQKAIVRGKNFSTSNYFESKSHVDELK